MHDQFRAGLALGDGHLERPHRQPCVQDFVHGPADDAPGVNVEQRHNVEPALAGQNASRIRYPNLVGLGERDLRQVIRRDQIGVATVGRRHAIFGARPRPDLLQAYQAAMRLRCPGQPSARASRGLP